ncbi:MAG: hypothetical protein LBC52_02450 [Treponema sp.]|jgi:hypothetical protein|nr:hypothetical protein [Treponema sp.]
MKKFFTTLLFLVIIAGIALFFGWAQLGIPPDGYGVIRSKTHGLYPHLVQPGEFMWIWYKLIPTNTETTVLRLNPVSHVFTAESTLPSGRIYSAFAGIRGDFSWRINGALSFSINPDAIIPLFNANTINSQEDLTRYENDIAAQIEGLILRYIGQEELSGEVETLLKDGENPWFEREIMKQFPFLNNFSLRVKSAKFPDFELYRQAKALFENYMAVQKEYASGDIREKARNRMDAMFRFDELELYGELLTKYPILLEYMALERGKK